MKRSADSTEKAHKPPKKNPKNRSSAFRDATPSTSAKKSKGLTDVLTRERTVSGRASLRHDEVASRAAHDGSSSAEPKDNKIVMDTDNLNDYDIDARDSNAVVGEEEPPKKRIRTGSRNAVC